MFEGYCSPTIDRSFQRLRYPDFLFSPLLSRGTHPPPSFLPRFFVCYVGSNYVLDILTLSLYTRFDCQSNISDSGRDVMFIVSRVLNPDCDI